jgi:hypothetical protein
MSTASDGTARAIMEGVRRFFMCVLAMAIGLVPLSAATLERLSLDDMIAQSTSIVRGKVVSEASILHGPLIYTHYKIQVTERYKGTGTATEEFMVPGGRLNGSTQEVAGAPDFATGREYVLFLWKGPSGNTQVIGLTQGVFTLPGNGGADPTATRTPSTELMLDRATGQAVKDERLSLRLSELKTRIKTVVKGSAQ